MSTKVYEAYRIVKNVDPFALLFKIKTRGQKLAKKRLAEAYRTILDGRADEAFEKAKKADQLFWAWVRSSGKVPDPDAVSAYQVLHLASEWRKTECPEELNRPSDLRIFTSRATITAEVGDRPEGDISVFDVDRWFRKKFGDQLVSAARNQWDLDACVTVRPFEGRFYLIPYYARESVLGNVLDFLPKAEGLEDFSYWDNVDPPTEVSESDWEERKRVWDALTPDAKWQEFLTLEVVSFGGWDVISPVMLLIDEMSKARKNKAETP